MLRVEVVAVAGNALPNIIPVLQIALVEAEVEAVLVAAQAEARMIMQAKAELAGQMHLHIVAVP